MKIDNHILKHYLKNCCFINGTAYAGKSTMCRLLSEKYGMLHMEENYKTDRFLSVARPDKQKDFTYFLRMKGFEEYVMRPSAYGAQCRMRPCRFSRGKTIFPKANTLQVSRQPLLPSRPTAGQSGPSRALSI